MKNKREARKGIDFMLNGGLKGNVLVTLEYPDQKSRSGSTLRECEYYKYIYRVEDCRSRFPSDDIMIEGITIKLHYNGSALIDTSKIITISRSPEAVARDREATQKEIELFKKEL